MMLRSREDLYCEFVLAISISITCGGKHFSNINYSSFCVINTNFSTTNRYNILTTNTIEYL